MGQGGRQSRKVKIVAQVWWELRERSCAALSAVIKPKNTVGFASVARKVWSCLRACFPALGGVITILVRPLEKAVELSLLFF